MGRKALWTKWLNHSYLGTKEKTKTNTKYIPLKVRRVSSRALQPGWTDIAKSLNVCVWGGGTRCLHTTCIREAVYNTTCVREAIYTQHA